ncbi:hypothetical protein JAAARDRAFT_39199 [Jaapia argillacea MUCL 33604]|uniref:Uncharacterized protein n=1 Tax=Jaapia argillacea MUCL 33604 TaxID=933084 RepID=A0A067PQD0_9AGAM|nr:hypothetical protein JAAARDRAFT_39199 [Jaapia argillacea MUCL 33604]
MASPPQHRRSYSRILLDDGTKVYYVMSTGGDPSGPKTGTDESLSPPPPTINSMMNAVSHSNSVNSRGSYLPIPIERGTRRSVRGGTTLVPAGVMFGGLIAGMLFALGHHLFYAHLSGRPVDSGPVNQKWANHIGAGIAYVVKTLFVFAIGSAYVQQLWFAARRSSGLALSSLDAGFGILNNPLKFLVPTFIASSPTLALIALISWTIPFVAIITPGALEVLPRNFTSSFSPCPIPIVDLSDPQSSLLFALYNTDHNTTAPGSGSFNAPSPLSQRLATEVLLAGAYKPPASPCGEVCAYTTAFQAPYFDCANVTSPGTIAEMFHAEVPVLYNGSFTTSTEQDYAIIGWAQDSTGFGQQVTNCTATNATYTYRVEHNGSAVNITLLSLLSTNNVATDRSLLNFYGQSPADPSNNLTQRQLINYAAILNAATSILSGSVTNDVIGPFSGIDVSGGNMVALSNFAQLNMSNWSAVDDMGLMMESLMRNISISLMSLNLPTPSSPTPTLAAQAGATCTQTVSRNVYNYRVLTLWIPYGIGLALCAIVILAGMYGLQRNGFEGQTSFSTLFRATRNPRLDLLLTRGQQVHEKPERDAKLRYDRIVVDGRSRSVFEPVEEWGQR